MSGVALLPRETLNSSPRPHVDQIGPTEGRDQREHACGAKCGFASAIVCHALGILLSASLVFFLWLAFVEPLYPGKGWLNVPGGCMVESADMVAIQGVLGNTDLLAQARLSYFSEANKTRVGGALATRTIATLGPKELEARWIGELRQKKASNETVPCEVDALDAFRVNLNRDEQPDGFVVFQMYGFGALCAAEVYFVVCLLVRRREWLEFGRSLGGFGVWPCMWPLRSLLCGPCLRTRNPEARCCGFC
jgi:hypothetical protein